MRKRLQPARFRNLYGGLQLRETTAAYGALRRRLRGLLLIRPEPSQVKETGPAKCINLVGHGQLTD